MNKALVTLTWCAMACLSIGCGGGSGSGGSSSSSASSGGSSGSGSGASSSSNSSSSSSSGGGQYSQYDTVQGTFTSTSGIQATLTGSFEGTFQGAGIPGEWEAVAGFDPSNAQTDFVANVSSPAGLSGQLELIVQGAGSTPAAATYTCVESATAPYANAEFSLLNSAGKPQEEFNGLSGSCSLTVETPTLVTTAKYFAHGSLNATLKALLLDGGTDTGTVSATW